MNLNPTLTALLTDFLPSVCRMFADIQALVQIRQSLFVGGTCKQKHIQTHRTYVYDVFACVCMCVYVCLRACMRAYERVCGCVPVRVRVRARARVRVRVRARVRNVKSLICGPINVAIYTIA